MFYIVEVEDYVRVEPKLFGLKTSDAVAKQLQETYTNYHDKEIGEVIGIISVLEVGNGIIIPGDGAAYYNSKFKLINNFRVFFSNFFHNYWVRAYTF